MKNKFSLIAILLALSFILKGQDYQADANLDKDSIKIGDIVKFTLSVPASESDSVIFPVYSEDTITSNLEILEIRNRVFNKEKSTYSKSYIVSSYDKGSISIPSQSVVINPLSDSLLLASNPVKLMVEPVVDVDTLKVDTVYSERSGVVVLGKNSFEKEIEQQIPDSLKESMSADSLQMLKDTMQQMYIQRFTSELFRQSGLREQTDILQIVESPAMHMFIVNHTGILDDYRIPGAHDTVFVSEYDTVAAQQALFTVFDIKDIEADFYETPLTLSEIFFYIWDFIKNNWWWLTALLVLILAAVYFYFFYKRGKPVFKQKVKPSEPAHVIAFRDLDRIKEEKLWQKNRVKDYYTDLTDVLRKYLENRFDVQAMEKTSDEIMELVNEKNLLDKASKLKLQDILDRSVLVKFAKSMPLPGENEKSLAQAREIVEASKEIRTNDSELLDAEVEEDQSSDEDESKNDNEINTNQSKDK